MEAYNASAWRAFDGQVFDELRGGDILRAQYPSNGSNRDTGVQEVIM